MTEDVPNRSFNPFFKDRFVIIFSHQACFQLHTAKRKYFRFGSTIPDPPAGEPLNHENLFRQG